MQDQYRYRSNTVFLITVAYTARAGYWGLSSLDVPPRWEFDHFHLSRRGLHPSLRVYGRLKAVCQGRLGSREPRFPTLYTGVPSNL